MNAEPVDLAELMERSAKVIALHRDLTTAVAALRFTVNTLGGTPKPHHIQRVRAVCRDALREVSR